MRLKIVIGFLAGLFVLSTTTGCIVRLEDRGELEFFFGTSVGLRSSTSETKSESEAELRPQTLEAWFGTDKVTANEPPPIEEPE